MTITTHLVSYLYYCYVRNGFVIPFYVEIMIKRSKLCACLCRSFFRIKGCGWWSSSIYLSIYPSIYLSISISLLYTVKEEDEEETNVYMSFSWQTLPFLLSSCLFFLSLALFEKNKDWDIKRVYMCDAILSSSACFFRRKHCLQLVHLVFYILVLSFSSMYIFIEYINRLFLTSSSLSDNQKW